MRFGLKVEAVLSTPLDKNVFVLVNLRWPADCTRWLFVGLGSLLVETKFLNDF